MKIQSKRGFTLVELLVVVLIIGVLASVALPLYQNAVDKSRWARLVSPARSIANAEEAIHMSQGKYTTAKEDLVVSLPTGSDLSYSLYTTENGDVANFVRVESSKLDDVRLARYYSENTTASGNVYCEAKSGNERAEKLCGKLLKGAEESTTDDGYKAYLIEGQNACMSSGMPYDGATGVCGWIDAVGQTIGAGGVCIARTASASAQMGYVSAPCDDSIVQAGGECRAESGGFGSGGTMGCKNSQVYEGGLCTAEEGSSGCTQAHIYTGGTCTAEAVDGTYAGGCAGTQIDAGGTCNGYSKMGCAGAVISGICNGYGENSCQATYNIMAALMGGGDPIGGIVQSGGVCNGNAAGACSGPAVSGYENALVFQSGAICNGNASGACAGTFQAGAKCYANEPGSCAGDYSQGGCCVGANCPSGTQCS